MVQKKALSLRTEGSIGRPGFVTGLTVGSLVIALGLIAYVCGFKIMDRDFWWHVTAGDIMAHTRSLIHTEPFAYTREGLPYLARYEWLSQVALYLVFHAFGASGIIIMRTALVAGAFSWLLMLDPKRVWLTGALAVYAANVAKGGFMDRPQLFTFVIFCFFLYAVFRLADLVQRGIDDRLRRRKIFILGGGLIAAQVLWVNFHGAAALVGIGFTGALLAEVLWQWWRVRQWPTVARRRARGVRFVLLLAGLLGVAMMVSPNTYHNLTYLRELLSDQTIVFIQEWQPRDAPLYVRDLGLLWVMVVASLVLGRRHLVMSLLVISGIGYLSLTAFRHEMLFIFAATGMIIYQLKGSRRYRALTGWLMNRPARLVVAVGAVFLLVGWHTHVRYMNFARPDHLHGYGVFDLARGAYDFIERERITGNMFNTYGIGGYLLYRGYPERPVYVDGRNVDYGFAFLRDTFQAGRNPDVWRVIEDRYQITYALIDYDAIDEKDHLPYSVHLITNPHWQLAYLDDWAAVFLKKDVSEYASVLSRHRYALVTPELLHYSRLPDALSQEETDEFERELRRVIAGNLEGVKARVLLAKLYFQQKRLDEAEVALREAIAARPYRPEPYALMGAVSVERQQWAQAGEWYQRAIRLAGVSYPDINFGYVAHVFERAGNPWHARWYRWRAAWRGGDPPAQPGGEVEAVLSPEEAAAQLQTTPDPKAEALWRELQQHAGEDVRRFNDEGVELASQGKYDEAKTSFLEALKINPRYPEALNNLGALAQEQGKLEEAGEWYDKALAEKAEYGDAHYNLASVYIAQGRYRDAQPHLDVASRLKKDVTPLLHQLPAEWRDRLLSP